MSDLTYKLSRNAYDTLREAFSQYDLLSKQDEARDWTIIDICGAGLLYGSKTRVRGAYENALVRPTEQHTKKTETWWSLTAKGARIIKHWHDSGITTVPNYQTGRQDFNREPPVQEPHKTHGAT